MEETRGPVEKNFTNAQIEAVKKIRSARDNYERLGLLPGLRNFDGLYQIIFPRFNTWSNK